MSDVYLLGGGLNPGGGGPEGKPAGGNPGWPGNPAGGGKPPGAPGYPGGAV